MFIAFASIYAIIVFLTAMTSGTGDYLNSSEKAKLLNVTILVAWLRLLNKDFLMFEMLYRFDAI